MPSTNQDSKTTTTPWKGYQPYLVGDGPLPSWLTQGAPTGMSEGLLADMAARAAGAPGSWSSPPPLDPFTYSPMTPPPSAPASAPASVSRGARLAGLLGGGGGYDFGEGDPLSGYYHNW